MNSILSAVEAGARSFALVLGASVVALAIAASIAPLQPIDIAEWIARVFGWVFLVPFVSLTVLSVYSWIRLGSPEAGPLWEVTGAHASNGIAVLALTFTLLGISLGIGSLQGQALNPETIQGVISDLTGHFSMAFMTTVVGLPTSALLRAMIAIRATGTVVNVPILTGDQK